MVQTMQFVKDDMVRLCPAGLPKAEGFFCRTEGVEKYGNGYFVVQEVIEDREGVHLHVVDPGTHQDVILPSRWFVKRETA